MALRRMFTKAVIRSSHFMKMPRDTQFLYIQMLLDADDDGFIANPELEVTIAHCTQEDLQTLINRQYLMVFPSGIALIALVPAQLHPQRTVSGLCVSGKETGDPDEGTGVYLAGGGERCGDAWNRAPGTAARRWKF